ncbi:hypothetical protein CF160_02135 [Enterococcus pseudoavium]|nr:hypothetical protein CF160_02135 [Enterococcus pseudoavium]
MALVEEIERLIDQRVDQRMKIFLSKQESMKPWVKMNVAIKRLDKDARWVRGNLCTFDLIEKGLVKKVGGEWHFQNPEFFIYVHDIWWPLYESE